MHSFFSFTKCQQKSTKTYKNEYIKFGFVNFFNKCTKTNEPRCVLCTQNFTNESMRASKMLIHLTKKHPKIPKKPIEYFKSRSIQNETARICQANIKC